MTAKVIVVIESLVIIAAIVLFASGNISWQSDRNKLKDHQSLFNQVQESAEILKPYTLEIDGQEMLVVPQFSIKGSSSWNFDYSIYTYDKENKILNMILR